MAASMRIVCGCQPSHFSKTVLNMRLYLPFNNCIQYVSMSTRLSYMETHVVATKRRFHGVTSMCCRGQSLHAVARGGCLVQATRVHFDAHNLKSAMKSIFERSMFVCNLRLSRTLFQCQVLNSPKSTNETESTSTSYRNDKKLLSGIARDSSKVTNRKVEQKENIKTIPNLLTTLRMASSPLLGYLVVSENFGLALGLFTLAGISDMLDGYIARNVPNQTSALGSALDPLADKLLVTILTVTLTTVGLIPLPLTGLIVFRDFSLIAGGFYIRYRSLSPPITLSRYFDISHATVSLTPTFISKLNTGLQLSLVALSLAAPVFGFVDHICLQALWWTTGATTFMSGSDYLLSWKKYVKLLEKDQTEL